MIVGRANTSRTQKMLGTGEVEFSALGQPPCLVAFHGFSGTASELRPLLEAAARAGFAVEGGLLLGHGARVEELQGATFDDWVSAARVGAAAAAARYGSYVLLGFSLGSLVALTLASERPAGLAGLVVLGNALTLAWSSRLPLAVLSRFAAHVPDVYAMKPRAADLVDPAEMGHIVTYDRHPLRAAVEVYRAGPRTRSVVGRIVCPTLVLHGRHDRVCPCRNAPWLAERLGTRDVTLRVFEKSGHVLACDGERAEVAAEVVAFLKRA